MRRPAATLSFLGLTAERIANQPAPASRRARTRLRRSLADRESTRTFLVPEPDHQLPKTLFHQRGFGSPFRSNRSNSLLTTCLFAFAVKGRVAGRGACRCADVTYLHKRTRKSVPKHTAHPRRRCAYQTTAQTIVVTRRYGIAAATARRTVCTKYTRRGGGHLGGS